MAREFTIGAFVDSLRKIIYDNFPYKEKPDYNPSGTLKHPKHPKMIRDVAFYDIPIMVEDYNIIAFDIGSDESERDYPYYHILNEAPTIRKKGKGTSKTKGSEMRITNPSERNFTRVSMTTKGYKREYDRNIRGKRNMLIKNATRKDESGDRINPNANSYENVHYRYIPRMIDNAIPSLCLEFGLISKRKEDDGLSEEYAMEHDMLSSFGYGTSKEEARDYELTSLMSLLALEGE